MSENTQDLVYNTCTCIFFQLCAVATAKLHTLVQTKLISSSAEASFLIGNLNLMVLKAVRGTQRFTLIFICLIS